MAWSHFLYCFSLITTCITHAGGWVLGLLVVFVKNTIHLRLFFSSLLCHTFWSHNLSIFSTRTALIGFDHDGRSFHITVTGKVALRFVFSVIRCSLAAFCRTACIWEGWWGPVYVASPLVYSGVLMFKPRLCCDVGATENVLHHPPLQQAHIYQMRHSSWESHKKKSRVAEQLWSCLLCFLSLFFHFLSLSLCRSLFVAHVYLWLSLFRSYSSPNFNTPVSSSVALWPMCSCLLDCLVLEVFVLMSRHTFADWFGFSCLINPNTPFFPSIPGALLPPNAFSFHPSSNCSSPRNALSL